MRPTQPNSVGVNAKASSSTGGNARHESDVLSPVGPAGPTREGHLKIEHRGIEPVPESARYGGPFRAFTVWFAPQITPIPFFIGTLAPSIGLGWRSGILAIALGTVTGSLPVAWLALMGPRTGASQLALSRLAFGRMIPFPALVNWISTIGWEAFVNIFGATAVTLLTGLPFWASVLLILAGQLILGIFGFEVIHLFEKWMTVILGAIFIVLSVKIAVVAQVPRHDAVSGANLVGSFVLMTAISAGYALGWATYASDYTRYFPTSTPRRSLFGFTFFGIVVGTFWMEVLGFAVAAVMTGESAMAGLRDVLGGGLLGGLAMVAAYLSTIAVNALNDYTGGLSLQAAGVRIPRPLAAALGALLAMLLTLYLDIGNVADKAENLLLFITYWIGAWMAIVGIDWLRRKSRIDVSSLMDLRHLDRGLAALVGLVAGFVACLPFTNTALGASLADAHSAWAVLVGSVSRTYLRGADVAYIVDFLVGGTIYWILSRPSRLRSPDTLDSAGTRSKGRGMA